MSARSGLVGEESSWPQLVPLQANFSMDRKNAKVVHLLLIFLGGPMAADGKSEQLFSL